MSECSLATGNVLNRYSSDYRKRYWPCPIRLEGSVRVRSNRRHCEIRLKLICMLSGCLKVGKLNPSCSPRCTSTLFICIISDKAGLITDVGAWNKCRLDSRHWNDGKRGVKQLYELNSVRKLPNCNMWLGDLRCIACARSSAWPFLWNLSYKQRFYPLS
jgi:hypothetical protein